MVVIGTPHETPRNLDIELKGSAKTGSKSLVTCTEKNGVARSSFVPLSPGGLRCGRPDVDFNSFDGTFDTFTTHQLGDGFSIKKF